MRITCLIQARMGSTRRPGKVLADLGGRPMLGFMLDRLVGLPVDALVVATSVEPGDDAIVDVARLHGAEVVRGPEDDVLERFVLALEEYPADAFIRLTADCPLMDPAVVRMGIDRYRQLEADHVSNALVRTFPDGLDVEVVSTDAVVAASREATVGPEREHVTPFIYRRPERFRLATFRLEDDLSHHRWTVDTEEDVTFVRSVVAGMAPRTDFGWAEILTFPDRLAPASDGVRLVTPRRDDPAVPSGMAVDDPGSRVWVATDERNGVLGWLRVPVRDGSGVLEIGSRAAELAPQDHRRMVRALQARIGVQVRELIRSVPQDEALSAAYQDLGFEPRTDEDGTVLRWVQPRRS